MPNYQKMYAILCAGASKALDELPTILANIKGRKILQDALLDAEEVYITEEESSERQPASILPLDSFFNSEN